MATPTRIILVLFIFYRIKTLEAMRNLQEKFDPALEPGDMIKITGKASTRSVALIRLHSKQGSCDTREIRPPREITCNPLVLKMRARMHKIYFYKKGMAAGNRDMLMKVKYYRTLYREAPYTLTITATYTGYNVTFNDYPPVVFHHEEKTGRVVMIRANSGDYSGIELTRKANIPLNEPNCGVRSFFIYRSVYARITHGQDADPGAYPWQVALRRRMIYSWAPYPHVCGGSLISSCWVLTAAHCVNTSVVRRKGHFEIKIGDLYNGNDTYFNDDEDQQTFAIKSIHIHPNFSTVPVPKNDVALIQLKKDSSGNCAQYGDFVKSVCLPEPGQDDFPSKTECYISGWGAKNWTDQPRNYPHFLQYGMIELQDFDECRKLYGRDEKYNKTQVTDGMLCAGSEGIDTCQGDSGGPLVCQRSGNSYPEDNPFVLWGVTSWGHGCGETDKPGVYAKVADFIDWIKDVRAGLV